MHAVAALPLPSPFALELCVAQLVTPHIVLTMGFLVQIYTSLVCPEGRRQMQKALLSRMLLALPINSGRHSLSLPGQAVLPDFQLPQHPSGVFGSSSFSLGHHAPFMMYSPILSPTMLVQLRQCCSGRVKYQKQTG